MPYITFFVSNNQHEISFEDMLNGISQMKIDGKQIPDTRTIYKENTPPSLINLFCGKQPELLKAIKSFNAKYADFIALVDKSKLYYSFKIPKASGGFRQIDAPNPELMAALRELKNLLSIGFDVKYHSCAFAYIKGRNIINAVERHQSNKSKWFLKLDLHNFFGSTTLSFVMNQLQTIYPFNLFLDNEEGYSELKRALSLCFLNDKLPQGTPISPFITNLIMIPVDYYINKLVSNNKPHIVYTRYADDMFFSSDLSFEGTAMSALMNDVDVRDLLQEKIANPSAYDANETMRRATTIFCANKDNKKYYAKDKTSLNYLLSKLGDCEVNELQLTTVKNHKDLIAEINATVKQLFHCTTVIPMIFRALAVFHAPYSLNESKVRYGSSAGRNNMLGVTLNKNNNITVGYRKKKTFKTMLFSFLRDYKDGTLWSPSDVQTLAGLASFYLMVEKEAIQKIIDDYSAKLNVDYKAAVKACLKNI